MKAAFTAAAPGGTRRGTRCGARAPRCDRAATLLHAMHTRVDDEVRWGGANAFKSRPEKASVPPFASDVAAAGSAADAAGANAAGARAPRCIRITFLVPFKTSFNSSLRLVGNGHLFGCWSPDSGIPMRWNESDVWSTTLDLPVNMYDKIVYKFVYVRGMYGAGKLDNVDEIHWQEGENRVYELKNLPKRQPRQAARGRRLGTGGSGRVVRGRNAVIDHLIITDSWGQETFDVHWKGDREGRAVTSAKASASSEEKEDDRLSARSSRLRIRSLAEYKRRRLERLGGKRHADSLAPIPNNGTAGRHVGDLMTTKYTSLSPESQAAVVRALAAPSSAGDHDAVPIDGTVGNDAAGGASSILEEADWDIDDELQHVAMDKLIASCPIEVIMEAIERQEEGKVEPRDGV